MKRRPLILLALAATRCATPPPMPPQHGPAVALAPDLMMTLPAPATLGRDLSVAHQVTARYGGRTVGFEGHIEAADGRFRLAIVDPLGRAALRVEWTEAAIRYEAAPDFPDGLRPENILADLVLIYWPPEVLRRALPAGAAFVAGPGFRAVTRNGAEVIRADFLPGPGPDPIGGGVRYANHAFGYALDIRPMGAAP